MRQIRDLKVILQHGQNPAGMSCSRIQKKTVCQSSGLKKLKRGHGDGSTVPWRDNGPPSVPKGDVKLSKEFWDKSFSDEDFVYGERENLFINHVSELIPKHAKVGCFAEGEGRNAVYLAKLGHDVTSYDQSVAGLDKTKALASQHNVDVETVEMDVTKESAAENQYDAAVMVFGHVPKQDQQFFIESMIGSVKTGG